MVTKTKLSTNVFVTAATFVVNGLILVLLYRAILKEVGVASFGIWSLVIGSISVAKISDLGLSTTGVKFVAKYSALNDNKRVCQVIATTTLCLTILAAGVTVIAYPIVSWFLSNIIREPNLVPLAHRLLPIAAGCFFVGMATAGLRSGLEGIERYDLLGLVSIVCSLVYAIVCLLIVTRYGIVGLAYAQLFQVCLVALITWAILYRILRLQLFVSNLSRDLFREMIAYGINFQVISCFAILYEPATKSMMSWFGGASYVTFYDLSSRIINLMRQVLVTSQRPLVANIAGRCEYSPGDLKAVFTSVSQLNIFMTGICVSLLVALAPCLSVMWLDKVVMPFVFLTVIMLVGNAANMFSVPAYFFNLGTGDMRDNVIGHAIIGIGNLGLGCALGATVGPLGVAFGTSAALLIGSAFITIRHLKSLSIKPIPSVESVTLLLGGTVAASCCWVLFFLLDDLISTLPLAALLNILFFLFLAVPIWHHSGRMRFQTLVVGAIPRFRAA